MSVAPTLVQSPHEHHRHRWLLVIVLSLIAAAVAVGLLIQFDAFGGSSNSTIEGSGVAATQMRDVAPFESVELAESNNVVIRAGEKQAVLVRADDNLVDSVTTEVHNGKLVIGNKAGNFTTKTPMRVVVTVPSLTALTLAGSGNIVVRGINTHDLAVTLSGSGKLTGSGTTTKLNASISSSGSGSVLFERLVADDVHAVLSGSGSIVVTATKSLDAAVPGLGSIVYAGNPPSVTKSVTGMGSITAK